MLIIIIMRVINNNNIYSNKCNIIIINVNVLSPRM